MPGIPKYDITHVLGHFGDHSQKSYFFGFYHPRTSQTCPRDPGASEMVVCTFGPKSM